MKVVKKIITHVLLGSLFVLVLTGCTNNNIQDTPTILAETNDAEQESSDVDSSQEEAKSEENGMVTLTIDPNLEGRTGTTISYSVGSEIDLSSRRYFFTREGYNRDLTLYFDADGQEMIPDNKFVIEEDTTVYLGWTKWSDDELPRINEYLTLLDESKKILTRPKAWNGDVDAFNAYAEFMDSTNIINAQGRLQVIDNPGIIDEMNEYRNKLVQTTSDVDEDVWYIWGDDMPDGTNPENFYLTHDSEDFTPFLVPYLAEDQSEVKGNMIVIAGGAFHRRANLHESYPAAEFYQNNGYNAFVLQYRVEPYSQLESFADLQRAIRYIKYNGENLGLAFPERVSAVGFSAGGMTISGMIDKLESDSLPSDYFNNYTPDEIDQVNSSLDAALNIYGAMEDDIKDPETKELPEMFFVVSEKDTTIPVESSISMYMDVFRLTRSELHLFADGIHGIGLGSTWNHGTYTAYSQWGDLSLTFLDITYGYQEKHIEN